MKNLNLLKNVSFQIDELSNYDHITIGLNDLYHRNYCDLLSVYFSKNSSIYYYSNESKSCSLVIDLQNYFSPDISISVVDLFYSHVSQSLIIFESHGGILSVPVVGAVPSDAETIKDIECSIQAVSWSPDEGCAILVTKDDKVIIMSSSFDILLETDLLSTAPVKDKVSVGWGKKETQFHGSEGKQAAKQVLSAVTIDPTNDDKSVKISWRGDSAVFAVSYFCPLDNIRKIKIFNEAGVLESVCEQTGGLEESLAWRPSGNLIATTRLLPNKRIVAFFERNGLQHGEFDLLANTEVKHLLWNHESDILSAHCTDTASNQDFIFLWTVNNYHWYLKKKLKFSSRIHSLKWDFQGHKRLYVFLDNGTCIVYDWMLSVDQSENYNSDSQAFVSVIDGSKLLLTPFQKCIIPPPMCKYLLDFPSYINSVSFLKDVRDGGNINDLCVFCDDKLYIYTYSSPTNQHELKDSFEYPELGIVADHHWLWLSTGKWCCVGSNTGVENILFIIELEDKKLKVSHSITLEHPVITIGKREKSLLIQLEDGKLFTFDLNNFILEPYSLTSLPEPCFHLVFNSNLYALSLTHRLYVNNRQILTGVISMHYQEPFLFATTTQHRLFICHTHSIDTPEELPLRNIERGALLVTTTGLSVILQIPRGNLETIQPRALTLLCAGKLLDKKDYLGTMKLLRRQRIDLNLIVDHNPDSFLQNISEFVKQIEDVSWLSLFISELNNNNVIQGLYSAYYKKIQTFSSMSNKVHTVCQALCKDMLSRNPDNYCMPILGTYVKRSQMEEALKLARTEEALKHLLFLVDIDTLYETALAIYNLELALKIASKSQKDPKEYVPFLNSLKSMEPNYCKFTIDKKLRKYKSAVKHLAASEDKFDELQVFVVEFSLYSTALNLFPPEDDKYKVIAAAYANYLEGKRNYEEAAFMYERSGKREEALAAYSKAGLWKESLTLASDLNYNVEEVNKLCLSLIQELKLLRNFADASFISAHYLKDIPLSVKMCIKGSLFSNAVYTAVSHNVPKLVDELVKPGVEAAASNILEDIAKDKEKFNKYLTRLKEIRTNKENSAIEDPDFLSDIHSETSSVSSFNTSNVSSSSTRTSCRSARKQQRKLWSLKKGNPREEISLISALSQIIEQNHKLAKDVHEICKFLFKFREEKSAKQLQNTLAEFLKVISENQTAIWPEPVAEENEQTSPEDALLKYPPSTQIEKNWELALLK